MVSGFAGIKDVKSRSVEVAVHKSLIIGPRGMDLELFQFSASS